MPEGSSVAGLFQSQTAEFFLRGLCLFQCGAQFLVPCVHTGSIAAAQILLLAGIVVQVIQPVSESICPIKGSCRHPQAGQGLPVTE